jgi:hypothetical protein
LKSKAHWATKCSKRGRGGRDKTSKKLEKKLDNVEKNQHGNNVTNHLGEAFVIIALLVYGDETLYVNSNVSMHLCHIRNWYFEFERISPIKIYIGNNSTQEVVGKGKMKMIVR